MNILIASRAAAPLHGWGGLERAVADLCTGLTKRGHRVTLLTTDRTEAATDQPSLALASLATLPWPTPPGVRRGSALDHTLTYPRVVSAARRWMDEQHESFDAAIGMGAMAAALVPAREAGRIQRFVLNPQGMEEFFGHPAKRIVLRPQQRLVRHAARHADHIIATDQYLVGTVRRTLRVPDARIAVVPNGVDVARIDALTNAVSVEPASALTLVSVARIVPNKGLHVLAEALGQIQRQLPADWRWIHVGDGPARGALESAIARTGIRARVTLMGNTPDAELHHTLAGATMFVHPTLYEGSSLVTLEAMTHALPVIASAAGGIPDKVVPGETGWLVPSGNVHALAAAIIEAARLPADRLRAIGAAGRARALDQFSLEHTLGLTESLLSG